VKSAQFVVLEKGARAILLTTNLAFAQDTKLPRASPAKCAEHVFRRRHADAGVTYYPHYWRPICAVLRLLPWSVFRKLSF